MMMGGIMAVGSSSGNLTSLGWSFQFPLRNISTGRQPGRSRYITEGHEWQVRRTFLQKILLGQCLSAGFAQNLVPGNLILKIKEFCGHCIFGNCVSPVRLIKNDNVVSLSEKSWLKKSASLGFTRGFAHLSH